MKPEIVWPALGVIVAAISATLLVLDRMSKQRESRQDLRVTAEFKLTNGGRGTSFVVHLVNTGQRPIHVVKVCLILKSGDELLPLPSRGRAELEGNESYDCWFPLYDYRSKLKSPLDVKLAEVTDSQGRRYAFNFRKLKKQILREWTPETDWLTSKDG